MSASIKPCPFCGAESSVQRVVEIAWVSCSAAMCGCGPTRPTESEAITVWNAAPRIPFAPPANTVRVRVAVSVDSDGHWIAAGGTGWHHEGFMARTQHHPGDRLTWLTADVPKPEPAAEVKATIE